MNSAWAWFLGEEDRLAKPVAAGDRKAAGHKVRQHLVHGVLVEQPLVDRLGLDPVGHRAVVVPFQRVPLVLFLFRQPVVLDALALELERHRDGLGRHQEAIAHRLLQGVGVGRYAVLQVEQAVGVAVHLVLGRRREPDQQRVEVVEDGTVLLEHRAVRLVDDYQVEMAHPEAPLAVARLVDQSHHGRIGRDVDASLGVLLGDQVDGRGVGQVALEGIDRLIHQRHPVGEEEHALGPVAAHEQVGERDHRACLASTRRHHEQRLAVVVALEGLGDAANGAGLVMALDDLRTNRGLRQRAPRLPPLDQQLQLRLLVETLHPARRVASVVPGPVFVAVRVKDDRPLPELAFQAIGVELGLLLPDAGVAPRALGLDQPERLAVVAPEDVVHETLALSIGHPADFELAVAGPIERPAGFL